MQLESVQGPASKSKRKDRDGLYKRRDYWHYELMLDGKKRSFTTGTKDYKEAKKIRSNAIAEIEKGRTPDNSGRKRLELVSEGYIAHRQATVSAGTVRLEKERLKPLKRVLGNVMLKDITPRTIRNYQASRAAEVSNRTVNLETKLLRGILKHEGQWDRLELHFHALKESGESPGRALTAEEAVMLFSTAESNDDWTVAYLGAVVANDTGMRSVEVRNLTLADIDIEGRKIRIRKSKTDSGIRTVALTNDALKACIRLLERSKGLNAFEPQHYLIPAKVRNGQGYDPSRPTKGWRTAWRALTRKAGVVGFRFHDLRHSFITAHAEMGTPLPIVMAQAGHLSRRMTQLYTHISQRAIEGAAEKFEQVKAQRMAEAKKRLESEAVSVAVN